MTDSQYFATDFPFRAFLNFSKATVLLMPSLAESKAIKIAKSLVLVRVRFAMSHWSYLPDRNANLLNGWSLCLQLEKQLVLTRILLINTHMAWSNAASQIFSLSFVVPKSSLAMVWLSISSCVHNLIIIVPRKWCCRKGHKKKNSEVNH